MLAGMSLALCAAAGPGKTTLLPVRDGGSQAGGGQRLSLVHMTETALPGPVKAHHHIARVVSLRGLGHEIKEVQGFNAKVAVILTRGVGTMACAYLFCLISFASLPAILVQAGVLQKSEVPPFLTKAGLILIVSWIAQTFIQLVLLSVIMVGQNVQSAAGDARAQRTYDDTVEILDRLDIHTEGGLKELSDRLDALTKALAARPAGA